jgi:hypothetical protein
MDSALEEESDDFIPATTEQWRAAYTAKIEDFARETLRASMLSALAVRLYQVLSVEWAARDKEDRGERTARRFWRDGLPPEERDALVLALEGHDMHLDALFVAGAVDV